MAQATTPATMAPTSATRPERASSPNSKPPIRRLRTTRRSRLDPRADRDRDADAGQPERPDEDDRDADVDDDGEDGGDDRRPGVAIGVERPGEDRDERPDARVNARHSDGRGQGDAALVEPAVAEQQRHDLRTEHDREDGHRHHHIGERAPIARRGRRTRHVPAGEVARHRREHDHADRDADDPDRDLEHRERDRVRSDGARTKRRRQRGRHEERHLARAEAERARDEQGDDLAGLRIADVEARGPAKARPRRSAGAG